MGVAGVHSARIGHATFVGTVKLKFFLFVSKCHRATGAVKNVIGFYLQTGRRDR